MADAARQILDDLITAMQTVPSVPLTSVYEDPSHAIASDTIPAVAVEPLKNPAESLGESQDEDWIDRHQFVVALTALGRTPDERDTVGLEVKQAVIASKHIGRRRRYVDTEYLRTPDGERRVYGARIAFEIEYLTQNTAPDQMV